MSVQTLDFTRQCLKSDIVSKLYQKVINKNITFAELAIKIGVREKDVRHMFSGETNWTLEELSDICYALNLMPEINFREIS